MLHDNLKSEAVYFQQMNTIGGRLPWQYYRLQMKVSNPMC